jgi:hypothetical protein
MSTRRRSTGSFLIGNLNPELKQRILEMEVDRDLLKKFEEEERLEEVSTLVDLRDLSSKSETEVYKTLNRMYRNKQ